jgi:hypothetical protein
MYTAAIYRQFCATAERVMDERLPLPHSYRRSMKNSHHRELITFKRKQPEAVHIPEICLIQAYGRCEGVIDIVY